MNSPFDFELKEPPKITEAMLLEEKKRRQLVRQVLILKIAAVAMAVSLVILAFAVVGISVAFAVYLMISACFSFVGSEIISFCFINKSKKEILQLKES